MSKRSFARLLGALVLALVFAPRVAAQDLDATWFKVKLKAKGAAVTPGGQVVKAKGKTTFYVFFSLNEGEGVSNTVYGYTVFSETAPDVFVTTSVGTLSTAGDSEELMIGTELGPAAEGIRWQVAFPDEDATLLQLLFVARLKTKFDKHGDLKKASFKSASVVVPSGTSGVDTVLGGAKLKAKLISADKVPFEP